MRVFRIVSLSILVSVCAWSGEAAAGWVIDQTVKGNGSSGRHQVTLQANRMKTLVFGQDGKPAFALIVDLNADTIVQVDYQERRYMSATLREYAQMIQGAQQVASEAMKQMQEKLKDMPPEQREAMEKMLRSQMPPAGASQACHEPRFELRNTREQATIAGYPATRYDMLADGKPHSEIWMAAGLTAWREMDRQKLERFMAEMAKAMPCAGQRRQGLPGSDPAWKLAAEGYAVRTVERQSGASVEVIRAESRKVSDEEFQAPAGFARTTLSKMLGR